MKASVSHFGFHLPARDQVVNVCLRAKKRALAGTGAAILHDQSMPAHVSTELAGIVDHEDIITAGLRAEASQNFGVRAIGRARVFSLKGRMEFPGIFENRSVIRFPDMTNKDTDG